MKTHEMEKIWADAKEALRLCGWREERLSDTWEHLPCITAGSTRAMIKRELMRHNDINRIADAIMTRLGIPE